MGVPRRAAARRGTTSSSSPRSCTASRCSTTSRSAPRCASARRRQAAVARHPDLRVRHELRRAVAGGEDGARARAPSWPAPAICSGEGGMLPEEQAENRRYFYELASARFGWTRTCLTRCRRSTSSSARAPRPAPAGTCPAPRWSAGSPRCGACPRARRPSRPPRFPTGRRARRLPRFVDEVRERSGGIPIGVKLSAQHIEADIDAALDHRRRLRDPRRPRRRHRRRADDVPRQHLACRRSRRSPAPGATSTGAAARDVTLVVTGGLRARRRLRQGARARRRRGRGRELGDPGHRLPRHARLPHRQLPGRHRHPEAAPARPAARSTRPPSGSTASSRRPSS